MGQKANSFAYLAAEGKTFGFIAHQLQRQIIIDLLELFFA